MRPVRSLLALAIALATASTPVRVQAQHVQPDIARVKFARGGHSRLPFELRHQHAWIRGVLQGRDSVWVVLDTGASASVLDQAIVTRLAMSSSAGSPALGSGGFQQSRRVRDVRLDLPGLSLEWPQIVSIDLAAIGRATGRPMDVVLGYELFRACVVRFDYTAGMVDIWSPRRSPQDLAGTAVPMTLINNHPYVVAELALPNRQPLRGLFVLDTGSSLALMLRPEIVARDSAVAAFPRTLRSLARGVGGEIENHVGRAVSLTIGDLRFDGPTVVLPAGAAGHVGVDGAIGNIGGEIMRRCRMTFDYSRKRVLFEPMLGFHAAFEANMAGAVMTPVPGGLRVRVVDDQTPAAEADLRVDDLVTSVDGRPAAEVDPAALRKLLCTEDHMLQLGIRRGDASIQITMKLRRIL